MKFILEIELGNDVMSTMTDVCDRLVSVAEDIDWDGNDDPEVYVKHSSPMPIFDMNGNKVGSYRVEK